MTLKGCVLLLPYFAAILEVSHSERQRIAQLKKYGKKSVAKSHTFARHTRARVRNGLNSQTVTSNFWRGPDSQYRSGHLLFALVAVVC